MPSLYLGKIASRGNQYEIHAVTKDIGFREYTVSEIADRGLYRKILEGRFDILKNGTPIYCTAVNPDIEQKIEENPHDSREGTVHIVSVSADGEIAASLSVAVDIGEKSNGKLIGVPLENMWKPSGFPEGASLDKFRYNYLRLTYGDDRDVRPWEMAELYRHYKRTPKGDLAPRLGVYTGWYHLGVREARRNGRTPTWLWVFDAIPSYYYLYKLVGKAVLRDFVSEYPPRFLSPNPQQLEVRQVDSHQELFYRGEKVSRLVKTLIPNKEITQWVYKDIAFLDGVADIHRIESDIRLGAIMTSYKGREGFSIDDRIKTRIGMGVAGRRVFEDFHANNPISNFINKLALQRIGASEWNFNEIGA